MKRRLRLERKERAETGDAEADSLWSFAVLYRVVFSKFGIVLLTMSGVAMVVVIADAPVFVAGLLAMSMALIGATRKQWGKAARGVCAGFAVAGLVAAGFGIWDSGERVWQKLSLIPSKLTRGSSRQRTEEDRAELDARRRARAEADDLCWEIKDAKRTFRDLPEQYPELLDALRKVEERVKQPADPKEDLLLSIVRSDYEMIKREASFYKGSHSETPAYKRVFGDSGKK